jgi:hypothetical protein
MKIGVKKTWELMSFNVFFSYYNYGIKYCGKMFGTKGSLPLKWKQKGKVRIMPCRAESPQAPKIERQK